MVSLIPLAAASAILVSLAPGTSIESSSNQTPSPQPAQTTLEQAEQTLTQAPAQCPPGQFLSPFSDVYPTDWAYGAVVQLAGVPSQCFDLPAGSGRRDGAF
ncbi:MAG: hypothetical protein ICV62_13410 [Cyanobacteria bacterium Co-bin13]|nr:hypothetical protein [Cyanobacteria bacterium Co-bin13]